MFIVSYKNIFFAISGVLFAASIAAVVTYGLHFGIDFTGGTLTEVTYTNDRPSTVEVSSALEAAGFAGSVVRETAEKGMVIRTRVISENEHAAMRDILSFKETRPYTETRFSFVGPVIGQELRQKAWLAVALVILGIALFIAFAFRKVSEPVSSWVYGGTAILALVHDVFIPTGVYVTLGHYLPGYEIDTLFVTAIMTILGFSVHDTIVIFDRVRENLKLHNRNHTKESFAETVGDSLRQTMTRSINTSMTVLFVLVALYMFGGAAIKPFALTLVVGIVAGTYSSIFIAAPFLVFVNDMQERKNKRKK
ncbi:MAG: protein translocase subunit SecF [Candidatus Yonathbacteria bacterium]|nr:protein translocase subunit SecF [Candidatus Yonathbacteria bacterium]